MSYLHPITKLPPELHLAIADQLNFPDNMNLRTVDRYFYKLIKPLSFEEGLEAEKSCFALENEMFICNSCLRLRRMEKFVEAHITYDSGFTIRHLYEDRSLTLPVPYCIDCGYEQEFPRCRLGDIFSNNSGRTVMSQVFCNGCEEFPELSQRKIASKCTTCWQKSSADFIQKLGVTDLRGCHMSKHCHHSDLCETCSEPFSNCHWVQKLYSFVRLQPGESLIFGCLRTRRLTSMSELKAAGQDHECVMMLSLGRSRDHHLLKPQGDQVYTYSEQSEQWNQILQQGQCPLRDHWQNISQTGYSIDSFSKDLLGR